MVTIISSMEVKNVSQFKKTFENHEKMRTQSGIKVIGVNKSVDVMKIIICFFTLTIISFNIYSQILLDPYLQQKFVNALPIPNAVNPFIPGGTYYEVSATQFTHFLGLYDTNGDSLNTIVWGYNGSYPGPTFEARRNIPITVKWKNELTNNGTPLPHLLPVDTTIHWAMPSNWPNCGVPLVTHLHGGHVVPESDGNPDAWFTPDFSQTGSFFSQQVYTYSNDQEPTTLWYHDHAMGITRLNVYAGLAGFYNIRDSWEDGLNLPNGNFEIPIVIQDRMFTANGQLFYPSTPEEIEQPDPSVMAEMFGDFILVNGKAWPVLNVEPRKYRFRFLNGSDSRFYNLFFNDSIQFVQIGTDGGFLNAPVIQDTILLGTGERKDIIIDFSNPLLWGDTLILRNNANTPFPNGDTVDMLTTGQIMAFVVNVQLSGTDTSVIPSVLRSEPIITIGTPDNTRQLILVEEIDEYERLKPQLGTLQHGPLNWIDSITENPQLNAIEEWQIINNTEDAHPIHLHLVNFQLVSRQKFNTSLFIAGIPSSLVLIDQPVYPYDAEKGWEDTEIMYPGEVTIIRAKFDISGLYLWHCHILSHEDHEMMRPFYVGDIPIKALAYESNESFKISGVPNPFSNQINITLEVKNAGYYKVGIYNLLGIEEISLSDSYLEKGNHNFTWNSNATKSENGLFILRVNGFGKKQNVKIIKTQ